MTVKMPYLWSSLYQRRLEERKPQHMLILKSSKCIDVYVAIKFKCRNGKVSSFFIATIE